MRTTVRKRVRPPHQGERSDHGHGKTPTQLPVPLRNDLHDQAHPVRHAFFLPKVRGVMVTITKRLEGMRRDPRLEDHVGGRPGRGVNALAIVTAGGVRPLDGRRWDRGRRDRIRAISVFVPSGRCSVDDHLSFFPLSGIRQVAEFERVVGSGGLPRLIIGTALCIDSREFDIARGASPAPARHTV